MWGGEVRSGSARPAHATRQRHRPRRGAHRAAPAFRAWKIRRRRSADRLEARIEAEVSARTTALGERTGASVNEVSERAEKNAVNQPS